MKTTTIALAAILVVGLCFPALSKTKRGDLEFSGSMSFMSIHAEWSEERDWYLNMAARTGVFLTSVFEIEPELMMSKWEEADLGFIFSLNLAINMAPSGRDNPMFFLLAGLGSANTTLYLPDIPYPNVGVDPDMIINAGCGFKAFGTEEIALRVEYRYQRFLGVYSDFDGHTGGDDLSYHLLFIGFSLFRN